MAWRLTSIVEAVEKVPKQILGRDAEKSDLIECATINDLMFGKGQVTPENVALTPQEDFSYRLVGCDLRMRTRKRKLLPDTIQSAVLARCKRRCCLCFCLEEDDTPKMDGQIAHIDHNRENSELDNLVYFCLRHHDQYDSVTSQSKGLTPGEVRSYRQLLAHHLSDNESSARGSATSREQVFTTEAVDNELRAPGAPPPPVVSPDAVVLLPDAKKDCRLLGIEKTQVEHFLLMESIRHPRLFDRALSSVPLMFASYVLLLSWDGYHARVERILTRERAYPLNDVWADCLSLYRRATILPYRAQGTEKLLLSVEAKRTTQHYTKLVDRMAHFLALLEGVEGNPTTHSADLRSLLDEADFALFGSDIGAAVARLEALLSITHKLLLRYAPQRAGLPNLYREAAPVQTPQPGKPTVLILDDEPRMRDVLTRIFEEAGFATVAVGDASTALRTLVEHDFDLLVADIMLCDNVTNIDGREVAIAAKRISPKTKIIVFTGYAGMLSDIIKKPELLPFDKFICKGTIQGREDLISVARSLLYR